MSALSELVAACRAATARRMDWAEEARRAQIMLDAALMHEKQARKEEADAYSTLQGRVRSAAEEGKDVVG